MCEGRGPRQQPGFINTLARVQRLHMFAHGWNVTHNYLNNPKTEVVVVDSWQTVTMQGKVAEGGCYYRNSESNRFT